MTPPQVKTMLRASAGAWVAIMCFADFFENLCAFPSRLGADTTGLGDTQTAGMQAKTGGVQNILLRL